MTDLALFSKFANLPADLKAEAADFIDFLVQKAAKSNSKNSTFGAEKVGPAAQVNSTEPQGIIIEKLSPLTESGKPRLPLEFGAGREIITYIADDFDAPLDDFKEYM